MVGSDDFDKAKRFLNEERETTLKFMIFDYWFGLQNEGGEEKNKRKEDWSKARRGIYREPGDAGCHLTGLLIIASG